MSYFDTLKRGANDMGISLSDETVERLVQYLGLLQKWNKAYNLTAIRDADKMVSLHLLVCLATLPFFTG